MVAVAFFMMATAFIVSCEQAAMPAGHWIAVWGSLYGLAMGFTRVLQGGHFVSDVLWAGIIVYLVGVGLSKLIAAARRVYASDGASLVVQDSISVAPTS